MQIVFQLKYWLITVAGILLISVFGRKLQYLINERINSHLIAASVFLLLVCVLLLLWTKREKYQLSSKMIVIASGMLVIAGISVFFNILYPIEAVHFLVFSWFGWISAVVLGPFHGAAAIFSIGVGDEILQHYLPNRVGDIHDVIINLLSGYTGLILRLRW